MAGAPRLRRIPGTALTVATVIYPARMLGELERVVAALAGADRAAACESVRLIRTAIETLATHPLLGPRVHGDIRVLVISCGRTGYVALYRFVVPQDEVRVLAIRAQREMGFVP